MALFGAVIVLVAVYLVYFPVAIVSPVYCKDIF